MSQAKNCLGRVGKAVGKDMQFENRDGTHCDCSCSSSTNRLITSKDHASVQLNVGHLDANGIYTGQFTTFALCGNVRAQGDADSALDRLWAKKKAELGQ
jgi:small subunit ribosomal protein S21e